MALILQFLHFVRLTVIPIIYYKIKLVQQTEPEHGEEGGEGGH